MRTQAIALLATAALSIGLAGPPASALVEADVADEVTAPEAPADDGTGGANDIPEEVPAPDTVVSEDGTESWETPSEAPPPPPSPCPPDNAAPAGSFAPLCAPLVCDPNHTWYKVSGSSKHGRVTRWSKHVKNDSSRDVLTFTGENSRSITAKAEKKDSISGEVALKKIGKVTLGTEVSLGLEGHIATKSTFSISTTFTKPGKWIMWRGSDTGSGSVKRYKCSSNGQRYSLIGSATPFTFKKVSITGTTNCANSVSERIERNAKALCS